MKTILTTIFCLFTLLGCAKKKTTRQSLSGTYVLTKQFSKGQLLAVHNIKSKISIDQANKRIACNVGCNSISGEFNAAKNKIEPLQLISTEMACGDYLDGLEAQFIQNLGKVNRYQFTNTYLHFLDGEQVLLVMKLK